MKETSELASDLSALEADSSALERKAKRLDDDLVYVRDKLAIPANLHARLDKLDSNLELASDLLLVVGVIPAISTAASTARRAIDTFRKPVTRAVKITADIDRRIKPVRTKVAQARKQTAKLDAKLCAVVAREQSLIQSVARTQTCIAALPSGTVKSESTRTVERLSASADPLVVEATGAQRTVLDAVNGVEARVKAAKTSLGSLIEIDVSITRVMKSLDPLIAQLQRIRKVFGRVLRVPYGGYPKMCRKRVVGVRVWYPCGWHMEYFSFSIQQVLDGVTGVVRPVMDLLNKAMHKVLDPLLRALKLDIELPDIPGLRRVKGLVSALLRALSPFDDAMARLEREAARLTAALDRVVAYGARYEALYRACAEGQPKRVRASIPRGADAAARGGASIVAHAELAQADPALFDAMVTLGDVSYLFRGNYYWRHAREEEEAAGPFAIPDEFGRDGNGRPLRGPFDAACPIGELICAFQGTRYYLCSPGVAGRVEGPLPIRGRFGSTARGGALTGPFDAAINVEDQLYLFKGKRYYVTALGAGAASGPHPIKGRWGEERRGQPLEGPFDAVTVRDGRLHVRKAVQVFDQHLAKVTALR